MQHYVGYSEAKDIKDAVGEAIGGLNFTTPSLVIFFSDYERFEGFSKAFSSSYPETRVIGSTSYLSISSKGCGKKAVSFVAFGGECDCRASVISDISKNPMKFVPEMRFELSAFDNTENLCCFEMTTALCNSEELVLDAFKTAFDGSVPIFGGSSGSAIDENDSVSPGSTLVSLDGRVYEEACVYALLKSDRPIHFFRENVFRPTPHYFTATEVDCENRIVSEFDGAPASAVLAKALGINENDLQEELPYHPLGRIINGELFITEGDKVLPDGSLSYYARIFNHTKMVLLELDDPHRVFAETVRRIKSEVPEPSFAFVVNCEARSILFENGIGLRALTDSLNSCLGDYVGFSGYGEQLSYRHFNLTMLVAVFE